MIFSTFFKIASFRKNKSLLLFSLTLFIILVLLISLISFSLREEGFECKGTSFCAYDVKAEKCKCAFQKDDARLQFPNDSNCCQQQCSSLPKEKCIMMDGTPSPVKYYCNIAGQCQEYDATIKDSVIMANICGIDNITNQYIMPFASKEECQRSSDPCNLHNDDRLSATERERGCRRDTRCGWCMNEEGEGKCVAGTPMGPNDLEKYYFCKPSDAKAKGKYFYGTTF